MTYNELKSEENKYVMNTYGRFPIALDHGEGATLWDVEGKKYIDLCFRHRCKLSLVMPIRRSLTQSTSRRTS